MSLTIDQLFNPAQSGVGLNPNVPSPAGTWYDFLISTAQILGLPTTAWQAGQPERTIMAMAAVSLQRGDVSISLMAQGGFLDFAATGTVTSIQPDGSSITVPVTPDPSIPSQNPDGSPGWLDALGQSYFKVTRLTASYASGPLAIANTGATTPSYVAGIYHVANTITGATYSNRAAFSVPPSVIPGTGGIITAVSPGLALTTVTTQTAHGLAVNDTVYVLGSNGLSGLNSAFSVVTAVTSTTFTIARGTSGAWTSGGTVYKCTITIMSADAAGLGGNASSGQVTSPITQSSGVFISNAGAWSAANFESNVAYAARCRLSLAARSPNGANAAYEYFALTAAQLLAAQDPPVTLTNGPIHIATAFSNPQTGHVRTIVASTNPASVGLGNPVTPGCAQLPVASASNATPIVITTSATHHMSSNDLVIVAGVLGNYAANGAWTVTVTAANQFELNGSAGSGAYTGGGSVEGGDLGEIDNLLQNNVTPDGQSQQAESALAFPIVVAATVVVPQAYVPIYQSAALTALNALVATYPIGGNIPPGGSNGTVPLSAIEGALVDAGVLTVGSVSYVRQVSGLTINGVAADLNYPDVDYVAIIATPAIAVIGV